jgi:hypothetical protein
MPLDFLPKRLDGTIVKAAKARFSRRLHGYGVDVVPIFIVAILFSPDRICQSQNLWCGFHQWRLA